MNLRLGAPEVGRTVTTTVLEVKRPMVSSNPYRTPSEKGQEFLGVRASECVHKNAKDKLDVYWSDFSAVDPNGGMYPASSTSWSDWPVPQFPPVKTIAPGQCAAGWLLIPVPKKQKITKIALSPMSEETYAMWRLRAPRA